MQQQQQQGSQRLSIFDSKFGGEKKMKPLDKKYTSINEIAEKLKSNNNNNEDENEDENENEKVNENENNGLNENMDEISSPEFEQLAEKAENEVDGISLSIFGAPE